MAMQHRIVAIQYYIRIAKFKVKLNFIRISVPVKVDFAKNTVTKMTGNAFFPLPDIDMGTMSAVDGKAERTGLKIGRAHV